MYVKDKYKSKAVVFRATTVIVLLRIKVTMHQVTTMLAASKNVDDASHLYLYARPIIKVLGHQHQWLAGGYDLEIRHT